MYNPFEQINRAFASDYRVNLRIVGLDGSIMLTLSDDSGITARRLIDPAQRNDPQRLQRVIASIQLGLAADSDEALGVLVNATEHRALPACAAQTRFSAR